MQTDSSPAEKAVTVTPGQPINIAARGLYVGVTGNVTGKLVGMSTEVTFNGLAGGMVHPLAFREISAATATGLLAVA